MTHSSSTTSAASISSFPSQVKIIDAIDFELLQSLATSVPLLTRQQAILYLRLRGEVGIEPRTRLEQLHIAGWIQKFRSIGTGPQIAARPRVAWHPGDPTPLLSRNRKRARQQDEILGPTEIEFYVASRLTANLFGVPYRSANSNDAVARWRLWGSVFRQLTDEAGECVFVSDTEDTALATSHGKLPEHLQLTTEDGRPHIHCLLYFSSLRQLISLHGHCEEQLIPYYLW